MPGQEQRSSFATRAQGQLMVVTLAARALWIQIPFHGNKAEFSYTPGNNYGRNLDMRRLTLTKNEQVNWNSWYIHMLHLHVCLWVHLPFGSAPCTGTKKFWQHAPHENSVFSPQGQRATKRNFKVGCDKARADGAIPKSWRNSPDIQMKSWPKRT